MKKKVLSLILTLTMLASLLTAAGLPAAAAGAVWDGRKTEAFTAGSGTREDPYLISTPAQLAYFRDQVNGGDSAICAKVVADLDLGGHSWTPIGLTQTGYTGIFDGGGREIRDLKITKVSEKVEAINPDGSTSSIQVGGLFGVVGDGGTVKYVNVSGQVTGDISASVSGAYLGGVAGFVIGTVEECFSTCAFTDLTVTNDGFVGIGGIGAATQSVGTVKNCYNVGTIDVTVNLTASGKNIYVGGITGFQMAKTSNCYSAAPIRVTKNGGSLFLGGVIGVTGNPDVVTNCHFDRQVCTSASYCAGANVKRTPVNPNDCSALDSADMKTDSFVETMGEAFAKDAKNVNNGYPILAVMAYGEEENSSDWYQKELEDAPENVYDKLLPPELMNKDLTQPITRVEFAAVAVKLYEEMGDRTVDIPTNCPFTDTTSDAALRGWAVGITNGITPEEDLFDPYATITRQDLATMLTRVYKALYLEGWTLKTDKQYPMDYDGVTPFNDDADISGYARDSVYFMVKNNVVKGVDNNNFAPKNTTDAQVAQGYANATREQAMIMAVRAFENLTQQ